MEYIFGIDLNNDCSVNSQIVNIKNFIAKNNHKSSKITAKTSKESFDALIAHQDVLGTFTYYISDSESISKLGDCTIECYLECFGVLFKVDYEETEFGRFIFSVEA